MNADARTTLIARVLGAMAILWMVVVVLIVAIAVLGIRDIQHDPFSQSNFPCFEDEALVYAPEFGTDRVGCVTKDDIVERNICPYGDVVSVRRIQTDADHVEVTVTCKAS